MVVSGWQVGDLAVCVRKENDTPIQKGGIYLVSAVVPCWDGLGLLFADAPNPDEAGAAWDATAFRKIRPDAHEGNARDWQLIVESTKRKVSA